MDECGTDVLVQRDQRARGACHGRRRGSDDAVGLHGPCRDGPSDGQGVRGVRGDDHGAWRSTMQVAEMRDRVWRDRVGEEDDPRAVGGVEGGMTRDARAGAVDRARLQDVERLSGGKRLLRIDQAHLVEPVAAGQGVGDGSAEGTGSEDGDERHRRRRGGRRATPVV